MKKHELTSEFVEYWGKKLFCGGEGEIAINPCDTCPNIDFCDGWEAMFCCTLCQSRGGGDCSNCDDWDI